MIDRRGWLQRVAGGMVAGGLRSAPAVRAAASPAPECCPLALKDYEPKSMLPTSERPVAQLALSGYQNRIMFGIDATPDAVETPQQTFIGKLYEIYYRFLETTDEYFDYAPSPVPPQGRWRIYGLGLTEPILR